MVNDEKWPSIEDIADHLMGTLMEKGMDNFAKGFERSINHELRDYTEQILKSNAAAGETAGLITPEIMVEKAAGDLIDSVSRANTGFFRAGMKAGAVLMMQLLN